MYTNTVVLSIILGVVIVAFLLTTIILLSRDKSALEIVSIEFLTNNDLSDGGIISRPKDWRVASGNNDIDLVITWAGANDDEGRAAQRQAYDPNHRVTSNRYADHGELLIGIKHVLGSPWLRMIHVVLPAICKPPTDEEMQEVAGEDWGNKVTFVPDSIILPSYACPSFSSHPVEANLHRIPSLSERFVYTCDDEWIVGDCGEDTFFVGGKAVGMYSSRLTNETPGNLHRVACKNTLLLLQRQFGRDVDLMYHHHHQVPLTISGYTKAWELFEEALTQTTLSRFRTETDIHPTGLVLNTMVQTEQAFWTESTDAVFISLNNDTKANRKKRNHAIMTYTLSANTTKFMCVNDEVGKVGADVARWFRKLFKH